MENNDLLIQQIEAYLSNKMDKNTAELFEQKINQDAQLASTVSEMRDLIKGIELAGVQDVKTILNQTESKLQSNNTFNNQTKTIKMTNSKNKIRWAPIAASLAFLVAAGMFFFSSQNNVDTGALYAQYYKADKTVIIDAMDRLEAQGLASEKTTKEDSLLNALKAYKEFDYVAARSGLSEFLKSYPENQTARFYMGLTQLQLGNYANANGYLQPLCTEQGFAYQDAAKWYLAMGCSQLDGPDGMSLAIKYLEDLARNDKSEYQGNAKAYLNALSQ